MNNQEDKSPKLAPKVFSWRDGKTWFDTGVLLFKQVKSQWYLACVVLIFFLVLMSNLSSDLVAILAILVSPVITAYMMNCCQTAKQQRGLITHQLWQPILSNINPLLILGVFSVGLSLLFHYIHLQVLSVFELSVVMTEEMAKNMSGKEMLFRALLNLITNVPIALLLAFSPPLVMFHNSSPVQAFKYSALGVIKSWKAFVSLTVLFLLLLFGVVLLVSLMMSVLQALFGAVSQIMITFVVLFFVLTAGGIGLGAQYQAYTEIFIGSNGIDEDAEKDDHGTEIYTEI